MRRYTVIFTVDGDYHVQSCIEHVEVKDRANAFDLAVQQARDRGVNFLHARDFDNATEIVTYRGWLEADY